ncbi:MAG: radical SAM protein [Anaerolineae bacterium]
MKLLPWWLSRWLSGNLERSSDRRLPVIQIEITSRCQMDCVFCAHRGLKEQWVHGDLPWELYRDVIAPELHHFELVYLQGWGEPTLHPYLWDMLELARQAGCRTGFTTNGIRLTTDYAARLLDASVDILCISVAGASAETHEALRVGSRFEQLVTAIEAVTRLKAQNNSDRPWLELHFLMTRMNIHELPSFVELAAGLGVDEAVATNLTYIPVPDMARLAAFHCDRLEPDYQKSLDLAYEKAQALGIQFRAYPLVKGEPVMSCDAQPLETAFINHMGWVTPCVYLGLSVKESIPRIFCGRQVSVAPVRFGHVSQGLMKALNSDEAEAFKAPLRKLKRATHPALLFAALAADTMTGQAEADHVSALPVGCQSCYKQYGL